MRSIYNIQTEDSSTALYLRKYSNLEIFEGEGVDICQSLSKWNIVLFGQNQTPLNSTQLKATRVEETVVTWNPHPTTQTFKPLLDKLESLNLEQTQT